MARLRDSYLTSGEAAKLLGTHAVTVSRLARQGRLPAEKVANRWLLLRSFIEEFADTYDGRRGRPRRKRKYTKRGAKWNYK